MNIVIFLEQLHQLNLQLVANKLMSREYGLGWTKQQTQLAIHRYKLFLYLQFLLPQNQLAPTKEVDEVWHTHILVNTYQYIQDCQNLYGYILHHCVEIKTPLITPHEMGTKNLFAQILAETGSSNTSWEIAACVDLPIYPHSPQHISACMTLPNQVKEFANQR